MNWNLGTMRTKLRELTGRLDESIIVDGTLDNEINAYYQFQFPDEVNVHEFEGWTTFVTVAGTATYSQPAAVQALQLPLTVTDSDSVLYPVQLYTSAQLFAEDYPDDAHDAVAERDRPEALLLLGREYLLRPVPDAVYTIKYQSQATQPTELDLAADQPLDQKWGPVIAYGAAIDHLKTTGRAAAAKDLTDLYTFYRGSVARKQLRQIPLGQRAAARI